MDGTVIVCAALAGLTVVYVTERVLQTLTAWRATPVLPPVKRDPMPSDLVLLAQRESEPWAREQTLAALSDQYDRLQDWDRVREVLVTR